MQHMSKSKSRPEGGHTDTLSQACIQKEFFLEHTINPQNFTLDAEMKQLKAKGLGSPGSFMIFLCFNCSSFFFFSW